MSRPMINDCDPVTGLNLEHLEADFAAYCAESELAPSPYSADLFASIVAEAGNGARYGAPSNGVHCYRMIFQHLRRGGIDLW